MAKHKILFTSHTANFSKFNRPLMRMLRGTLEKPYDDLNVGDWQVDYASANEEPVKDADNVYEVDFARSPLRFDKHVKACRQLKKIIAEGDYDIIHTHTPVGSIVTRMAARAARKKGTKVIYTCHGFHFYDGAPKQNWRLYYPIEKRMAKDVDMLVTINREDYNRAKKDFSCPVRMIDGAGVDVSRFKKTTKAERKAARKKYGLNEDDFVIVYVAEFTANKNQRMLVEALAPIMKENEKVKLLFLGEGELMGETKKLAKELGASRQVVMPGYIRDGFAALLQSCNLCTSASIREGLGLGVLEGVLCGLPIVIADNRGHRDIVSDKKKYLFDLNDIPALTEKMRDAIKNPEKYHLDFPERFSLHNSLSEMREIYKEVLA
ncbi:glycosyltransferase [Candidatus Saccharibacteria bacterium]|nr:glycosyltransferase [Candidatus Saccharibacteria bacterium]